MDDELQELNFAMELEHQREEECEHGIHRDSGHVCMECLLNNDPGYGRWLTTLEKRSENE